MSIFSNSFFSVAGQKERLSNVVATLGAAVNPFDSSKVVANVSNPTGKAVLELAANNPYTTALAVAVPASAPARAAVGSTVSGLSTGTKLALTAGALITVPAVVTSQKTQVAATKAIGGLTPEALSSFGADLGRTVDAPSWESAQNLIKEHPVTTAALGTVAGLAIGGTVAHLAEAGSRTINSLELAANTNAMDKLAAGVPIAAMPTAALPATISNSPPTTQGTALAAAANPPGALISSPAANAGLAKRKVYKRDSFGSDYGFVLVRRSRTQTKKLAKAPPGRTLHTPYGGQAKRYVYQKDTLYEERAALRATP